MKETLGMAQSPAEQDRRIAEAYEREQPRLRSFIRRRVADRRDAEDILQEVFTELVEAYRMFESIDQVGAWLFRVARNRIVDMFRKKKPVLSLTEEAQLLVAAAPHLRAITIFALDTGMRRGEILHQTWEDVDFERRLLNVTHSKTPEGEAREPPGPRGPAAAWLRRAGSVLHERTGPRPRPHRREGCGRGDREGRRESQPGLRRRHPSCKPST